MSLSHRNRTLRDLGPRLYPGLVWLAVAFNMFVLAWMAGTSLRGHRDIFASPWGLPYSPMWENFAEAWTNANFGPAALNTFVLVAAASVFIVLLSAPASFVLGRNRGRLSSSLTLLFALGIGIPTQVIIIPLFVLMESLALVNSLFGLFLLYVAVSLPFTVFLLTGFFSSLPDEIEEAAAIDGASMPRSFWSIMLPLARPGLITALILNAITLWNETFLALIFLQSADKQTLPWRSSASWPSSNIRAPTMAACSRVWSSSWRPRCCCTCG